jgi:membrane protease YdiL (CAAX protease family)
VIRPALIATLLALVVFSVLMGVSIELAALNARLSPDLPWFGLPVALLLCGAAVLAERHVGIGLWHPPEPHEPRVYGLALAVCLLGTTVCVLQGALHGMTHAAEIGPPGTGRTFQMAYALLVPVVAAVAAELSFRGLMQTRLQALMPTWTAIAIVAVINTAAHRWGPNLAQQWLGYFVLLAGFGWLRWKTRSLLPPLIAHALLNIIVSAALYAWGPVRWSVS